MDFDLLAVVREVSRLRRKGGSNCLSSTCILNVLIVLQALMPFDARFLGVFCKARLFFVGPCIICIFGLKKKIYCTLREATKCN